MLERILLYAICFAALPVAEIVANLFGVRLSSQDENVPVGLNYGVGLLGRVFKVFLILIRFLRYIFGSVFRRPLVVVEWAFNFFLGCSSLVLFVLSMLMGKGGGFVVCFLDWALEKTNPGYGREWS